MWTILSHICHQDVRQYCGQSWDIIEQEVTSETSPNPQCSFSKAVWTDSYPDFEISNEKKQSSL